MEKWTFRPSIYLAKQIELHTYVRMYILTCMFLFDLILHFISGFVFEFISTPVIKAFSSATAVLVIESQIKVLLGIKYLVAGFIESVKTLSLRYQEANLGDLVMGSCAILFLIGFEVILLIIEMFLLNQKYDSQLTCLIYINRRQILAEAIFCLYTCT